MPSDDHTSHKKPDLLDARSASSADILQATDALFDQMIDVQMRRLMQYAHTLIPYLTEEDILQPHDYPVLERDPRFQYEDGYLAALRSAKIAFRRHIYNAISPAIPPFANSLPNLSK